MSADVIIIGAGIVGCATAYYIGKMGYRVTVLEKSSVIGDGGSSRNGGGVRQSGRDKRELPLMMYGVSNIWPHLSDELGVDVEYCQRGNLRLGKTDEHRSVLKALTANAQACGLDVQMIDGDEARQINPYLSADVTCASWCPTDGHANPLTATLGYYRRARQLGVTFLTDVEVTGIRKSKGKFSGVDTSAGFYAADMALLAAGIYSRQIAATVGIDVPMGTLKMETLVTEAMPTMFPQMLGTAMADFYGHQTKDNSFVFGGSAGYEMYNRDNGTPVTSSIAAGATCRGIMGYFPILENAKVVRTWGGWIDQCADGVPVMGDVEEVPGLFIACAFTGHGFGIGPPAAYAISQLMTTGVSPIDLSPFHYDRFRAKI
ncbi:MAG: NAD(P)/FAD-dependent oxidoreductase [Lachnospiraceae bacterium]